MASSLNVDNGAERFNIHLDSSGNLLFNANSVDGAGNTRMFIMDDNGSVGIGTTDPNRLLHVQGEEIHSGGAIGGLSFGNRETAGFVNIPANGERWVWYSTGGVARLWSGSDKVFVNPSGRVGIGIGTPDRLLHVQGEEIHSGGAIGGLSFGNRETAGFVNIPANGERWVWYSTGGVARLWSGSDKLSVDTSGIVRATQFVSSSSRELKANIAELSGSEAIATLENLTPVKFNYKADSDKNLHVGFIAEDVPELVATSDRKGLSATDIVAVLTKALQEQRKTIVALGEKVKMLEAQSRSREV
jgi:hypothetical protein